MKYCKKCMYPETSQPTIYFDDDGVCSGCRYDESRKDEDVDWKEREEKFRSIIEWAKKDRKERGTAYDCIIPISGGKDSHFQVWICTQIYGLKPLLVTYNHGFNNPVGNLNFSNLVEKSGCDAIRYTSGTDAVKKLSKFMLDRVGDLTWHYHAGLTTVPFQVAKEKEIPLIIWGEHGFAELTGIVSLKDFVEFTNWKRIEHDLRGIDPISILDNGVGITEQDIAPFIFPTDQELADIGITGIYMSNYFDWDALTNTEKVIKEWGFNTVSYKRDRTFNLYSKTDDQADEIHDYLKFLKFGYGRATDDASTEIRKGRLDRSSAISLVKEYDQNTPRTLQNYLDFMEITKDEFYGLIENQRDPRAWEKGKNGWNLINPIWEQEEHEITSQNVIFKEKYRNLYYNEKNKPSKYNDPRKDDFPLGWEWA